MPREHHYRLGLTWSGSEVAATTSYAAYSREFLVEVEGKPPWKGSADPLFRGDPALYNPEEMLMARPGGVPHAVLAWPWHLALVRWWWGTPTHRKGS